MLRAKKPTAVEKRLKLFMFGPAGVGKSTAAIQFPNAYIIDCEKGVENYDKLINKSGGVVFQTTDINEVIAEVRSLLTEKHDFRTLVIDPITAIYNDLLEKSEAQVGSDFGRHYGAANKTMKRLANLIMALDMNVVITSHAKKEYGANLAVIGQTFDAWKQLDYWFDLVVELRKDKKSGRRVGFVAKTRLEQFPDGEVFEWSYETIAKRYGAGVLEKPADVVAFASPDQVAEMVALLDVVKLPEGTVEKWFAKAVVDTWADMPAEVIQKCIDFVRARFPQANVPRNKPPAKPAKATTPAPEPISTPETPAKAPEVAQNVTTTPSEPVVDAANGDIVEPPADVWVDPTPESTVKDQPSPVEPIAPSPKPETQKDRIGRKLVCPHCTNRRILTGISPKDNLAVCDTCFKAPAKAAAA